VNVPGLGNNANVPGFLGLLYRKDLRHAADIRLRPFIEWGHFVSGFILVIPHEIVEVHLFGVCHLPLNSPSASLFLKLNWARGDQR